ncbi:hypothetical protein BDF14DRAFT_1718488 [Spinellus fusiger]|nr:hypothetical protein BDF14DRAFT_1718488 [Spinellus fusiger]
MFFSEEYNEENVARLSKKIADFGSFDVCYETDPRKPVLVSLTRIRSDPFSFKRYTIKHSTSNNDEPEKIGSELSKCCICYAFYSTYCFNIRMSINTASELQVIAFLNEVYITTVDTPNESAYCLERVTTNDIYDLVITKTDCMSKKSKAAFATWCSKKGIHFMNSLVIRKRERGSNSRYRELYVLKDEYIGSRLLVIFAKMLAIFANFFLESVVENIAKYVPKYQTLLRQTHMNSLKSQSYIIIGYARKSPGHEVKQKRIDLLNRMVRCLMERSMCDKIFVSSSCLASDSLASRDINEKTDLLAELTRVDGNTQSDVYPPILHISAAEQNICLVALDFAGLSTNVNDLHSFVSKHEKLKTIIIDNLPFNHKVHVFQREAILNDPLSLSPFNCRSKSIQRSKAV